MSIPGWLADEAETLATVPKEQFRETLLSTLPGSQIDLHLCTVLGWAYLDPLSLEGLNPETGVYEDIPRYSRGLTEEDSYHLWALVERLRVLGAFFGTIALPDGYLGMQVDPTIKQPKPETLAMGETPEHAICLAILLADLEGNLEGYFERPEDEEDIGNWE